MKTPLWLAELGAKAMGAVDAETAHHLTIRMLKDGFGPKVELNTPRLAIQVAGLSFPNPLGLAA
ncbi:MAG: dihydroorotate dehydrogenase (quinone), partial [Oricola sp.]|nr:dihydroorotate dehydrogenase (quinone) [Oricola sp.]